MLTSEIHMNEFFSSFFEDENVKSIYETFTANEFDKHIKKSIPKFKKSQLAKINYIIKSDAKNLLDIGGTTGALCKTISTLSNIKTVNVDINKDIKKFSDLFTVSDYEFVCCDIFDYEDYSFDIVNETMTLQFIDNQRLSHVKYLRNKLNYDGVLFIEEKLKGQFFYIKEFLNFVRKIKNLNIIKTVKKTKLIKSMNNNLVSKKELEEYLKSNFKYVYLYNNSLNFYSYFATNSETKYNIIKNNFKSV